MTLRQLLVAWEYRDSYDWIFEFMENEERTRKGCGWGLDPKNEFEYLLDRTVYSIKIGETTIEIKLSATNIC